LCHFRWRRPDAKFQHAQSSQNPPNFKQYSSHYGSPNGKAHGA
jgi:hypothetical protein